MWLYDAYLDCKGLFTLFILSKHIRKRVLIKISDCNVFVVLDDVLVH